MNSKIPDSPFKNFTKDCRAGSKKQDLRPLAAILVAWQVGVDKYIDRMKKISKRLDFISEFINNDGHNRWVQEIAKGTLMNSEKCLSLAEIKQIMNIYLATLPPLKRESA